MNTMNDPVINALTVLLEQNSAALLEAQKMVRAVTRALLARKVLALEPAAVRLDMVPEEFEEGVRAHSAAVFDSSGKLLRSFEGDSENPLDESITGLLEAVAPEAGSDAWFRYVSFLERCSLDLVEALRPESETDPWLRFVCFELPELGDSDGLRAA